MGVFRRLTFVLFICCIALPAQRSVDPHNIYHRVVGVLPLIGSGTAADPIRPKYAPAGTLTGTPGTGIIAYAFELSDDGKHAIAELVAVDRTALLPILADHTSGVLIFEKGRAPGSQIQAAVSQYRKDFSLRNFGVAIQ
jgi:hypothetical protein